MHFLTSSSSFLVAVLALFACQATADEKMWCDYGTADGGLCGGARWSFCVSILCPSTCLLSVSFGHLNIADECCVRGNSASAATAGLGSPSDGVATLPRAVRDIRWGVIVVRRMLLVWGSFLVVRRKMLWGGGLWDERDLGSGGWWVL
jgi:hypothetical protein